MVKLFASKVIFCTCTCSFTHNHYSKKKKRRRQTIQMNEQPWPYTDTCNQIMNCSRYLTLTYLYWLGRSVFRCKEESQHPEHRPLDRLNLTHTRCRSWDGVSHDPKCSELWSWPLQNLVCKPNRWKIIGKI